MKDEKVVFSIPIEAAEEIVDDARHRLLVVENLISCDRTAFTISDIENVNFMLCECYCLNYTIVKELQLALDDLDEEYKKQKDNLIFLKESGMLLEQTMIANVYNGVHLSISNISLMLH